jgi:hypothetical protein
VASWAARTPKESARRQGPMPFLGPRDERESRVWEVGCPTIGWTDLWEGSDQPYVHACPRAAVPALSHDPLVGFSLSLSPHTHAMRLHLSHHECLALDGETLVDHTFVGIDHTVESSV